MDQAWSWILVAIGVTGWWLVGNRNKWGWAIGVFVQVLWGVYAVVMEQYGFIAGALIYGTVAARNLHQWTRDRVHKCDPIECWCELP